MIKRSVTSAFIIFLMTTILVSLETPEQFLGFKPGTDRELAHYNKIKEYFIKLGSESPG